jgi:hypothetical protein
MRNMKGFLFIINLFILLIQSVIKHKTSGSSNHQREPLLSEIFRFV